MTEVRASKESTPENEDARPARRGSARDALPAGAGRECEKCREWKPASEFYVTWHHSGKPYIPRLCKWCAPTRRTPKAREIKCANPECDEWFVSATPGAMYHHPNCKAAVCRRRRGHKRQVRAVMDGMKRCTACGETKPEDQFPRHRKTNRSAWCLACFAIYARRRVRERLGLPANAPSYVARGHARLKPEGATYRRGQYVMEKRSGHHRANRSGWVPQHILAAEEKYGFPITDEFTVHHRNNDKHDNRPRNLDLRVGEHGVHGDVIPTLLRFDDHRTDAIGELLDHPAYRAELFAEIARLGYTVLAPSTMEGINL